ncbi:MAG: tripartite tricarboxylate transporter TctB family protein [Lachnospiraceae bacterium]
MKLKRDQITGAVLVLLGCIVAVMVNQFRIPFSASYPGPKALPMIAVIGFIICGAGVFITSTRNKEPEPVFLLKEGWLRSACSLGLLVIYVLGLKYVGYLISTPIISYLFAAYYAKGSNATLKAKVLFSILFTIIIYVIYIYAFGLGLPTGELFG